MPPLIPTSLNLIRRAGFMLSVKEANQHLSKAWEHFELTRQEHFAILDDSDDDDPLVILAEAKKPKLEMSVQNFLRRPKNIFAKIGDRIPLTEARSAINARKTTEEQIQNYTKVYAVTTGSRKNSANTSDLSRHAFKTSHLSDALSLSSSLKGESPQFRWKLRFRQLSLSDEAAENFWDDFNEERFQKWWRRNRTSESPDGSEGWKDMKRLSRRVVIQILERIEKADFQRSPHIQHLENVAEICRETVLYQDIFCFNIRQKDVETFQEIVEYTVPIMYLASEVIHLAWSVMHQNLGIAGNYRVEAQIQKLSPYMIELRDRCFRFGQSVGFDVRQYWNDFMAGSISNTRLGTFSSYHLGLSHSDEKEDTGKLARSVIRNQIRNNIINGRSSEHVKELSKAIDVIVRLDSKVLLDMGLQQFTDVTYDTRNHKGEGAYADVYEMKRDGKLKSVAVKRCKPGPKSAKRVEREARNWIGLRHKHIAPLLGFVCFDVSLSLQPCLVSELYHTDLKKLVRKYGKSAGSTLEHSSYVLTEERKLKFLRDISYALEFMHASNTVHGDLRAANILVTNESLDDPSCYAVLNDFGMAEYYDDDIDQIQRLSSVNMQTSAPWLAPELFEIAPRQNSLARVSKEGDVYAFGAVFLEVVYERDPYQGSPYSIEHAKSIGELPALKEDLEIQDELHWSLMEACWESVEKRPSMVEIGKQHLDIIFKVPPEKPVRHSI
ncbi:hypothetical protein ACEPAG_3790 [Sanghuangporus baumii]